MPLKNGIQETFFKLFGQVFLTWLSTTQKNSRVQKTRLNLGDNNLVEQPEKIIWNIVKAVFLLWCATDALLFLTGRLRLSHEKEIVRKKIVRKYKWILIVLMIILYIGGIGMLIGSIIKIF